MDEECGEVPAVVPHDCGGEPDDPVSILHHECTLTVVLEQVAMHRRPPTTWVERLSRPLNTPSRVQFMLSGDEHGELAFEVRFSRRAEFHGSTVRCGSPCRLNTARGTYDGRAAASTAPRTLSV